MSFVLSVGFSREKVLRLKTLLRRRSSLLIVGLLWATFVGSGLTILQKEEFTPAPSSSPAALFPVDTPLSLALDKPTLLVFAHPQCPCTRASFAELAQFMLATKSKLSVVTVFSLPPGVASGWSDGELLQTAKSIPEGKVFMDKGSVEARRFNVRASGTVLLYAPSGELLFSGGLTASRGHAGDSLGREALTSWVVHGRSLVTHTPVFGCSLL